MTQRQSQGAALPSYKVGSCSQQMDGWNTNCIHYLEPVTWYNPNKCQFNLKCKQADCRLLKFQQHLVTPHSCKHPSHFHGPFRLKGHPPTPNSTHPCRSPQMNRVLLASLLELWEYLWTLELYHTPDGHCFWVLDSQRAGGKHLKVGNTEPEHIQHMQAFGCTASNTNEPSNFMSHDSCKKFDYILDDEVLSLAITTAIKHSIWCHEWTKYIEKDKWMRFKKLHNMLSNNISSNNQWTQTNKTFHGLGQYNAI